MTIRLNPQGYKPTKKERIEHNMDNFDRKVGRALDHYNAGEVSEEQFISEISCRFFGRFHKWWRKRKIRSGDNEL